MSVRQHTWKSRHAAIARADDGRNTSDKKVYVIGSGWAVQSPKIVGA